LKYTTLLTLSPRKNFENKACLSLTAGPDTVRCRTNKIKIVVCPQHVTILSVLCKTAFSCRNVFQRGQKRQLFKTLFDSWQKTSQSTNIIRESNSKALAVEIPKVQIICFDTVAEE
jgi:hypothetical protein